MGLRITVLTILFGLLWSTGPYFYEGHKGCVECHIPHLETDESCVECHRGIPGTNRTQIAHYRLIQEKYACYTSPDSPAVKDGHRLINTSGCRRCHTTGGKGNELASNLDTSFEKTLPKALAGAIENPATFMPNFYFREMDIIRLVNAILESSVIYGSTSVENRRVLHFDEDIIDNDHIFNKRCGSCHRILTLPFGGMGQGHIGPNLSGIFSRFYFKNFKDGKYWNSNRLKKWLRNPRDIRINAQMVPISLTEDEFKRLADTMIY